MVHFGLVSTPLPHIKSWLQAWKCHLLANSSQQNAQNKAYSCLKTNCPGKWKEFHAEKRISILLTEIIVLFCPSNVVTKWRVLIPRVAFVWRSKTFPAGLPKNFSAFIWGRHLALCIGRKVMAHSRIPSTCSDFCVWNLQFYVCQKSVTVKK